MEQFEEALAWQGDEQNKKLKLLYEERMDLIEKLITLLPPLRQMVLAMRFVKGWNIAAIAHGMELTEERVQSEIWQGLDFLKKVITAQDSVSKQPEAKQQHIPHRQKHMQAIFNMRHKEKLSFHLIAIKMRLSPIYVRETFIQAHAEMHDIRQTG